MDSFNSFITVSSHCPGRDDNGADAINAETQHSKNSSDVNSDSTVSSPDETTPLDASCARRSQGAIPKSRRVDNSSKEKSNFLFEFLAHFLSNCFIYF